MKKIYAVATESDVVLAFESRSDADEYAGEHDGMAVLPVPCVGAYEYPSEKPATDWDRIADALPKGGEQACGCTCAHANAAARRCRRPWRVTPRWC